MGLGATDKMGLTLEAVNIINNGNKNYLRTEKHEAVDYFIENGIDYESFDYLYEELNSFEDVYNEIVRVLLEKSKEESINYFVPGNPLIAESTVVKILEKTEDINLVMGMSFIEPVLKAVKRDPSKGLKLLDGDEFNILDIDVHSDIIITQVYNKRIAVDLKLALSEIYGDEYFIYLITDAGLRSEEVNHIPIYRLDRVENINHQSAIYIPKSNEIINFKDIVELLYKNGDFNLSYKVKNNTSDSWEKVVLNFIEALSFIIEQEKEGLYYSYEILEEIYKKVEENADFSKLRVEKINNIGYNYNSLEEINNKKFIDELIDIDSDTLERTINVIDRVMSIGFIWNRVEDVLEKVTEELNELRVALANGDSQNILEETGDLIFTCLNLCRFLDLNVNEVLNSTVDKFVGRFSVMSELASQQNIDLTASNLEELDSLYNEAKSFQRSR